MRKVLPYEEGVAWRSGELEQRRQHAVAIELEALAAAQQCSQERARADEMQALLRSDLVRPLAPSTITSA